MEEERTTPFMNSLFRRTNVNKILEESSLKIYGENVNLLEFIKDRLYFVTLSSKKTPKDTNDTEYFSIDNELVYANFLSDFGPLHVGNLYKYFCKVKSKLDLVPASKRIVHFTTYDPHKRANAAFLIATFAVLFLHKSPMEAYKMLLASNDQPFKPFQDAAVSNSCYQLRLLDCLEGIFKAHQCGFVRFNDFDLHDYEYYSTIKHGDLNWIVPRKLLAHSGPVAAELNTPYRPPEFYVPYFLKSGVSVVIRLNNRAYDPLCFKKAGIDHKELYFSDGSCPTPSVLNRFLQTCEETNGAVAVHCKAGLGRTGSLIGAYIMKHYRMRAKEAIAWMRIARPGCVIGKQQMWLEDHEEAMWAAGDAFRMKRYGNPDHLPFHHHGINSVIEKKLRQSMRKASKTVLPQLPASLKQGVSLQVSLPLKVEPRKPATVACKSTVQYPRTQDLAGPSLLCPSPSQGSLTSKFKTTQKGRKNAYVVGKVLTAPKEEAKDVAGETQGDKLRRVKAAREKWYWQPNPVRYNIGSLPPNV